MRAQLHIKKNMTWALVAVMSTAMLASCADDMLKDPNQSSDLIRFRVADRITRSTVTSEDATSTLNILTAAGTRDTLYMYSQIADIAGNLKQTKTRASLDDDLGDFMLSCAIEKDGNVSGYYFENQKYSDDGLSVNGDEFYWLNTGTQDFRFYGVAPAAALGSEYSIDLSTQTRTPAINYTVPAEASRQLDLKGVVSDNYPDDYKKVVPLGFKHLCTAIAFRADESVFPGKILNIRFDGVYSTGTYDMKAGEWQSQSAPSSYSLEIGKDVAYDNTVITPEGEASLFMMPQTLPEGAKITVEYENSVSHAKYQLSSDLSGMEWPAGKVINYVISTSGIAAEQIGLHIHGLADKNVLPAKVSLTPLWGSDELLNAPITVSDRSFNIMAPQFIDNLVDRNLTGKQYYKLTLTNTSDPANSQELMVEYVFDYMAFTVNLTNASESLMMPFNSTTNGGQTTGATPSTLLFRWQPGDFSDEMTRVTEENMSKTYSTPGTRQLRVYSNLHGQTAVPAYLATTKTNFPLQTVSVDTKLLKGPNLSLDRTFLKCKQLKYVPEDLFADNTQVGTLSQTFQECSSLPAIPAGLFAPLKDMTTFNATFRSCTSLTSLPKGLFDNNPKAESFSMMFHQCTGLRSLPDGLFDKCPKGAWFENTFQGCTSLASIPGGLFAKCPAARSFSYTFHGCSSLGYVPADTFRGCVNATDFSNTFQGCASLTEIGSGLFDDCVKGSIYHATFSGTGLRSIPANLFSNSKSALRFSETFANCQNLVSVPGSTFAGCALATNFHQVFNSCKSLTSIPSDLFSTNVKAQDFNGAFNSCSSLQSIPYGLFSNNKEAKTFNTTFEYCSGITKPLPAGLFAGLANATDFTLTFRGCSKMPGALPADMFRGCSKANNFTSTFFDCNSLEGPIPAGFFQDCDKSATTSFFATFCNDTQMKGPIPTDLFKGFTNVTNMTSFFYGCRFLSGPIPANLFADNVKLQNLFAFFGYCNSLTGEIPATLFANNPQLQNVNTMFYNCNQLTKIPLTLFDNCPNINDLAQTFAHCYWIHGEVPALWEKYPNAAHKACFYRVGWDGDNTGSYVTNYNAIPEGWKGAP